MKILQHLTVSLGVLVVSCMCLVPASGVAASPSSDEATALSEKIAQSFDARQVSALIAAATGRGEAKAADVATQMQLLQRAMNLDDVVAVALLRIVGQQEVRPDQVIKDLAQAAALCHAVTSDLAAMNPDAADEQQIVASAQAAMNTGRFGDAEAQIKRLEELEVAAADQPTKAGAPYTSDHRFAAAQARTLLGKIALMQLQYSKATEDFQLARQRLAVAASPGLTTPEPLPVIARAVDAAPEARDGNANAAARPGAQPPVRDATPPLPRLGSDPLQPVTVSPQRTNPDALSPAGGHDGMPVAAAPVIAAMVAAPTVTSPALHELSKSTPLPAATETAAKPPRSARSLSADVLELLLRRGDALLALGDLAAARLLYERAAEAGDARGATGVGKTYDPQILSQLGARGIQPDPALAAAWYQKALALGDASAAARLRLLGQVSGQ
jgi:TPR repeat protein